MMTPHSAERPHTKRWAYRRLYTPGIFERTTRLYPFFRRSGFQLVCRTVAWTYAVTQHAIRRIVRDNIALLTKESVSDQDAVKVFLNYGATLGDYVAVGAMNPEEVKKLDGGHSGAEYIENATQGGRGIILATGHFGFFEYGAVVLREMGCRMAVVTLPEPTAELTEWRARWRSRWGTKTIAVGADPFSSLQVTSALEEGYCMAMLADRPIGERSLPVDLPNGRIPFSVSPAILGWVTGCPILPANVTRQRDGRYHVTTKAPIHVRRVPRAERDGEIARCTREIAASLFEDICRDPRQWYQFVPVGL
jgi:KDO2-lipid IV(A) lauroyltransferase